MEENDIIEQEENLALTSQDIIHRVIHELVPLALATYQGILESSQNEKIKKETADTVMEIAKVRKTEDSSGGVSFHFSADQIQTAFGPIQGLKDIKIKQVEEVEEDAGNN
ncbi:MAG TPA: hypothetical protein ENI23_16450 [bacterium]|nr:hypothetical protein [bacterium]